MAGQPNLSDFSDLPGPVLELIFKSLINCPDCTVSFCRLSSVCKSWQQVLLSDIYWYSSDFVYRQSIKVPASYAASFTDCNLQALAARCHGRPLQLDLTGCKRLSTFAIMTLLFRNNSQLSEVKLVDLPQVAPHNCIYYVETMLARPVLHLKRLHFSCYGRIYRTVECMLGDLARSAGIDFLLDVDASGPAS